MNKDIKEYIRDAIELANSIVEWASRDYMDDSSGNGRKISELYDEWSDGEVMDERPVGVHITGPDGCGKQTALLNLLRSIKQKSIYEFVYFDKRSDINGSLLTDITNELIETNAKEKSLCLIIDGYDCENDYYRFLYGELYKRWLHKNSEIFLIIIDNGTELPSFLYDIMYTFRISRPKYKVREGFIRSFFDSELDLNTRLLFEDLYGMDNLAGDTEGLTFKEIKTVLDELKEYVLENKDQNEETVAKEINDIIDAYKHVEEEPVVDKVLLRVDALIDAISKISVNTVQKGSSTHTDSIPILQTDMSNVEEYGQKLKKELNDMPVKELVASLEERINYSSSIDGEDNNTPKSENDNSEV